jgi:hypothetical protein
MYSVACDSISWVINEHGYVYGSVIASCANTGTTFLLPFNVTLESIRRENPGCRIIALPDTIHEESQPQRSDSAKNACPEIQQILAKMLLSHNLL